MGAMRWELVGCLALAWIVVALSIMKGVKSSGKVVYFTATFPYVMLIVLFVRGITLDGAYKGIEYYLLRTNTTKLLEVEVWSDAASQIFYSLGVCFGGLMTLASYNQFNHNCMRDAILISISNCMTSVFSGFVIFSVLGFLAKELGVEVKDVATSGSGLAFVVYPAAINLLPLPQLWSVLFFFMIILVGLDTQFTMMEAVITSLCDQFMYLRRHKSWTVFGSCFVIFLCGLPMCLEGGTYMFELFTWHAAGLSLVIVAFFQVVVVQYVYGFKKFIANIQEMDIYIPKLLHAYWGVTWLFITPVSLGVIFCSAVHYMVPVYWGNYVFPSDIQILGWFLCATSVVCVPIGAIYVVWTKGEKPLQSLVQPTSDFCPAHMRNVKMLPDKDISTFPHYSNEYVMTSEMNVDESSSNLQKPALV
ncbi:neurotransmitter:sodium symporter activity protein [Halocaridina rubra]|uniref:Neurotransmitter:sodium symporter activity protein n=1 Tax=Halocaridina rubra TaxID=373956 RepID=A0AAN8WJ69_HALRR